MTDGVGLFNKKIQIIGKSIHFTDALMRLNNNEMLYFHLLEKFKNDYFDAAKRLKDCIREKKYKEAASIVHTIKGLSGNLGAVDLNSSAKDIEKALKSEDPESLKEYMPHFIKAHEKVLNIIELVIQNKTSAKNEFERKIHDVDASSVILDVEELKSMLLDMDLGASAKLETLMPFFIKSGRKRLAFELKQKMDVLDYAAALNILERHEF